MTVRYVLSLPGAFERRKEIKKQFSLLGLDFEIVDAKKFSAEEIRGFVKDNGDDAFQIGVGAVGCFYSHIEAWKRVACSFDRGGFIFEDDAFFSSEARDFCADDKWIPEGVDVCQLSYWPSVKHPEGKIFRVLKKINVEKSCYELIRIYSPCPWGAQGYWISREGAQKALEMLDKWFVNPVDFYLFSKDSKFWRLGKVYSLSPAVVTELPGNVSQRISIDSESGNLSSGGLGDNACRDGVRQGFKKLFEKIVYLFCEKRYHGFEP